MSRPGGEASPAARPIQQYKDVPPLHRPSAAADDPTNSPKLLNHFFLTRMVFATTPNTSTVRCLGTRSAAPKAPRRLKYKTFKRNPTPFKNLQHFTRIIKSILNIMQQFCRHARFLHYLHAACDCLSSFFKTPLLYGLWTRIQTVHCSNLETW
jgi:hypothetical protein